MVIIAACRFHVSCLLIGTITVILKYPGYHVGPGLKHFQRQHIRLAAHTMLWSTKRISLIPFLRRYSGLFFFLVALFLFFDFGLRAGRQGRSRALADSQDNLGQEDNANLQHPIPALMEAAEEAYRQKLDRQSKTLNQAVKEYKRRYKRPPPKGFDAWWAFAQNANVKLIDEYDGLTEDLAPFWGLSGQEIRRRAEQAGHLPSIDMLRIRNGDSTVINIKSNFKDTEVSARVYGFKYMMENFVQWVCASSILSPRMSFTTLAS